MNLLRKLSWFFNLEKKRYLIGIGSLILVSFLNLIPPRIMGLVIDLIDKRRLTLGQLVVDIALLVLAALAMYGLRFVCTGDECSVLIEDGYVVHEPTETKKAWKAGQF